MTPPAGPRPVVRTLPLALAAALLLASPALALPGGAGAEGPRDAALLYLAERSEGEDGFPSASIAPYLVEAAVAAGLDPALWPPVAGGALGRIVVPEPGGPLLALLRPAHALALAGVPLGDVSGRDLASEIRASFDGTQFGDPALLNDDAFAILALAADGASPLDARLAAAGRFLAARQAGGWSWAEGGPPGTDMTGIVLHALAWTQTPYDAAAAWAFLETTKTSGGGWGESPAGDANCQSTVWGLRATALLGTPPPAADWDFLLALQAPDGGFRHQPGHPSDPLCTAEAATLLGLAAVGGIAFSDVSGRSQPETPLAALLALLLGASWKGRRQGEKK